MKRRRPLARGACLSFVVVVVVVVDYSQENTTTPMRTPQPPSPPDEKEILHLVPYEIVCTISLGQEKEQ